MFVLPEARGLSAKPIQPQWRPALKNESPAGFWRGHSIRGLPGIELEASSGPAWRFWRSSVPGFQLSGQAEGRSRWRSVAVSRASAVVSGKHEDEPSRSPGKLTPQPRTGDAQLMPNDVN